ncbi:MAG: IS66 family insertion sequence element accessory protein TnpB [Acidobacteriaceae bacterium]
MLNAGNAQTVYLACGSTDLRKSIDGLAALVTHSFALDLFSSCLFVFCNKHRDKLKILHWDHNGFWLYYRRLEKGTFRWPARQADQKTIAITRRQLAWLLDGLPMEQARAHKPVDARIAA